MVTLLSAASLRLSNRRRESRLGHELGANLPTAVGIGTGRRSVVADQSRYVTKAVLIKRDGLVIGEEVRDRRRAPAAGLVMDVSWVACLKIGQSAGMRFSNAQKMLAVALFAYVVADILLTPPAGLESRNPALVTPVGVAALALLFLGLALSIFALVLLFRRSSRAPIAAIVAGALFLPAPLTEVTGHFSSLRPPVAIASIEVVQTGVAVIVVVIGGWLLRRPGASPVDVGERGM